MKRAPEQVAAHTHRGAVALSFAALALVVAAAISIHSHALHAPLFADDYLFLDVARDRSLPATLAAPDPLGNYLRPVSRQVAFWLLARAGGESPSAFHHATLGLFAVILALLFVIVRGRLQALTRGIATPALQEAIADTSRLVADLMLLSAFIDVAPTLKELTDGVKDLIPFLN